MSETESETTRPPESEETRENELPNTVGVYDRPESTSTWASSRFIIAIVIVLLILLAIAAAVYVF